MFTFQTRGYYLKLLILRHTIGPYRGGGSELIYKTGGGLKMEILKDEGGQIVPTEKLDMMVIGAITILL